LGGAGSQGTQGYQGPQGSQGFQGIIGTQGSQGYQGSQGFQGPQGEKPGVQFAADHGTAATDELINVCYGTGAQPAADTVTEGGIYIKYTA